MDITRGEFLEVLFRIDPRLKKTYDHLKLNEAGGWNLIDYAKGAAHHAFVEGMDPQSKDVLCVREFFQALDMEGSLPKFKE